MSGEAMGERRLVTFALLCFNQEPFIAEAVRSALAQDYSPLEILISDDASTDGTWEIVERLVADYCGQHRLRLNRNDTNLGVGAHTDLVMAMAQGEMVVLAAGDDISESDRVHAVASVWMNNPEQVQCVTSLAMSIDDFGDELGIVKPCTREADINCLTLAETGEAVLGATLAISRETFKTFGPLGHRVEYCEDVVLPFRAALLGEVAHIPRPLVRYRVHSESLMSATRPGTVSKRQFVRGIRRISAGVLAAREHQIADLNKRAAQMPSDLVARVTKALEDHLFKAQLTMKLLGGCGKGWKEIFLSVVKTRISFGNAVKTILFTKFPGIWVLYTRWRAR